MEGFSFILTGILEGEKYNFPSSISEIICAYFTRNDVTRDSIFKYTIFWNFISTWVSQTYLGISCPDNIEMSRYFIEVVIGLRDVPPDCFAQKVEVLLT